MSKKKKIDIWAEGKYIDLWSIPHVLSGIILFMIFQYLGMGFWFNFILATIIMTWWEFFEEHFMNVNEYITNKIMDVVTGIIGWLVIYFLIVYYGVSKIFPYFLITVAIYLLLNFWGLSAHLNRVKKN